MLLVAGPDLRQGGAEVASLASVYRAASAAAGDHHVRYRAPAPRRHDRRVLAAMAGVWVTHIAAHGTFRADSPLFSSLRLDDGALFVHDFDRLRPAPRNVVLSACDSGVSAPVGVEELLGLVGGLLRVGTANVLASVGPVNDKAAVPFMSSVHRALADGTPLPEAARQGRRDARGDGSRDGHRRIVQRVGRLSRRSQSHLQPCRRDARAPGRFDPQADQRLGHRTELESIIVVDHRGWTPGPRRSPGGSGHRCAGSVASRRCAPSHREPAARARGKPGPSRDT